MARLARVHIPVALARIVAAWRDLNLSDAVAVLVQEYASRRQLLAASPLCDCRGVDRVGRTADALALDAFQPVQSLHLKPIAVVIADIDTVQRRPLRQISPDEAGRRARVAGIGRIHDGRGEGQRARHAREHFDLELKRRDRAAARRIHGRGCGILGDEIERQNLHDNQQRGQKADHEHDAGRQGKTKTHDPPNRLPPEGIAQIPHNVASATDDTRHPRSLSGLLESMVPRDARVSPAATFYQHSASLSVVKPAAPDYFCAGSAVALAGAGERIASYAT
ncbi:hypothetical protein AB7M70_009926 [Bradyrhizobium japonicum]